MDAWGALSRELYRDKMKIFTVVFYTTHNAPSAPFGPVQERTLQYTDYAETFITHYTEDIVKSRVSSQRITK